MGTLDQYRASLESSRTWFQEHHGGVVQSFQVLDDGFGVLLNALRVGRDASDRTHISLAPLLMILQRQSFVALDALSSMQAYQAWVLVRPGIESALFMGKWMDDVANYNIWERRFEHPQSYRNTYSGKALHSKSLPRSDQLQGALKGINDSFAHPNLDYYLRHVRVAELESGDVEMKLHFFDEHSFHWATVLSLLHLLIVTQDAVARMFAARFVNIELAPSHFGLEGFEGRQQHAARKAADAGKMEGYLIRDLGLWDFELSNRGDR